LAEQKGLVDGAVATTPCCGSAQGNKIYFEKATDPVEMIPFDCGATPACSPDPPASPFYSHTN
jgi:hypothetical protein